MFHAGGREHSAFRMYEGEKVLVIRGKILDYLEDLVDPDVVLQSQRDREPQDPDQVDQDQADQDQTDHLALLRPKVRHKRELY